MKNKKYDLWHYSGGLVAFISICLLVSILVAPTANAYGGSGSGSWSNQLALGRTGSSGNHYGWSGATIAPTPTPTPAPVQTTTSNQGSISGTVYNDLNQNGVLDSGEPLLSGWTINLYNGAGWSGSNNNAPIGVSVSDANGSYKFSNLSAGTYSIEEVNQPTLTQFTVDYNSIVVTNGLAVTGENFANVANNSVTPTSAPTVTTTVTAPVVTTTPVPTPTVTIPTPTPAPVTTPAVVPIPSTMQWGAYVGDGTTNLSSFESMAGKSVNILADFEGWDASFPTQFTSNVGQAGKTLAIFWEPSFGYDTINNGSQDAYIKQFATDAKSYGYPVILAPFDEFNLNETAWGYGTNGNTAAKFVTAWKHIHDIFVSAGATNVKFAIDYNNVPVPATSDNSFAAYYPGAAYVDYVSVDGFNFGNPWQSPSQIFSSAVSQLETFSKPLLILSTGSVPGAQKAQWMSDFGTYVKTVPNLAGWVYFNSNSDQNWLVNTDTASLSAFKAILP